MRRMTTKKKRKRDNKSREGLDWNENDLFDDDPDEDRSIQREIEEDDDEGAKVVVLLCDYRL